MRVFKQIIAFIFLVLFFIFSLSSFYVYYNGDIVYNVFFDYENEIIHPLNFEIVPSNMHEMLRAAVEIGKCNSQLHRI